MSKTAALMLVLVLLTASCTVATAPVGVSADAVEDSWVSRAPMQEARSGLGVAAVNGKIYAIGGSNSSGFMPSIPGSAVLGNRDIGGYVGTNEEYDPATDTWALKTSMPTSRIVFATAVYQNKIYCIGGKTGSGYTKVNEVYDPATDTWETKASMPNASDWLMANVVNDKIYVMDYSGTNYVYDPTANSWNTKTPVPAEAFFGYASAVFDSKIYVIGGLSQDQNYNVNQIYDTETDTWSYGASPPSSVGGGAAAATTGVLAPKRIYVIGVALVLEEGAPQYSNRVYNPKTDTWATATDLPTDRYNFGIAVVNDTIYVIGGHTYSIPLGNYAPSAVNEQYTPIGYGTPDLDSQSPLLLCAIAAATTIIIIIAAALALKKRHKLKTTP